MATRSGAERSGAPQGQGALDWVTRRFRDFTPGESAYRRSRIFAAKGFDRVVVPQADRSDLAYLRGVGLRPRGSTWVRDVVAQ